MTIKAIAQTSGKDPREVYTGVRKAAGTPDVRRPGPGVMVPSWGRVKRGAPRLRLSLRYCMLGW